MAGLIIVSMTSWILVFMSSLMAHLSIAYRTRFQPRARRPQKLQARSRAATCIWGARAVLWGAPSRDPYLLGIVSVPRALVARLRGAARCRAAWSREGAPHSTARSTPDYGPTRSMRATWPSVGSAQQNHGSVSRGGLRRSAGRAAPSGRGATAAAASAGGPTPAEPDAAAPGAP